MTYLLLGLLALAQTDITAEERFRTDGLLEMCRLAEERDDLELVDALRAYECLSYVRGVTDTLGWYLGYLSVGDDEDLNRQSRLSFPCIPLELTPMQAVRVFVKWADDNPQEHHRTWIGGLSIALFETWPPREDCGL